MHTLYSPMVSGRRCEIDDVVYASNIIGGFDRLLCRVCRILYLTDDLAKSSKFFPIWFNIHHTFAVSRIKVSAFFDSAVPFVICTAVSYTHLRAHETRHDLVCRLLLEKKKKRNN